MTYELVPLSKLVSPISRPVPVVPGQAYRTLGVRWWGEGAYERETIDGSQTAAKTLWLVKENDLIINKIWVRHGSTAVVSAAVDGCAASGEFPTFELDQAQLLPRWMYWQTKARYFWEQCANLSRGSSGKNRIKPELFLTVEIPLPPIEDQRRIVARLENMAQRIDAIQKLQAELTAQVDSLMPAVLEKALRGEL